MYLDAQTKNVINEFLDGNSNVRQLTKELKKLDVQLHCLQRVNVKTKMLVSIADEKKLLIF